MNLNPSYQIAINDFHRMRRRVGLQKIFNLFRKQASLLSYEDIRQQLRAVEKSGIKLQEIPLSAIQGSVGRYSDFTRDFLPTKNINPQRWARVKAQVHTLEGIPPIDVYKIGEVYFVLDGNHRVSVAREMGNSTIEAYVRQVATKVPLEVDETIDNLLIKAEFAEFLEQTQFNIMFPDVNFMVTTPGCYQIISQQIEAIHFARELNGNQPIPYSDAVNFWYDTIYYPIVQTIREQDILKDYPDRTETDLFLWIFKHRASLAQTLGWEITPKSVTKNLTQQKSSPIKRLSSKSRQLFYRIFHRQEFDTGPPPGTWRREKMAAPEGRLFANIIVVIDGSENGWETFSQGIQVAGIEGSQLFGLHITKSNRGIPKREQQAIQAEFGQRCESYDTRGQLVFDAGNLDQIIKERACWADLVLISASDKLKPNIQSLVQSCPAPLLVTNGGDQEYKSILLAYDGSPKSEEALFLAAYLTTFWELSLTVMTILEKACDHIQSETILNAKEFLDYYGVSARYLEIDQDPVEYVLNTAQDLKIDLIVLGGLGTHKIRTTRNILGEILENSQQAIMICR